MDVVHLVGDVAGAELADLVGNADEHHAGGEFLAPAGRAPRGGVAAIGPAGHADAVGIGHARFDQRALGVDQIGEFGIGVAALVLLGEGGAIAGRAAIIGLEHGIALARRDLARPAVIGGPAVRIMRFGAAMDIHDQRRAASGDAADRFDQHAFDFLPVAGGEGESALRAEADIGQPRIVRGPPGEAIAFELEQLARMGRRVRFDENVVFAHLDIGDDQCAGIDLALEPAFAVMDAQHALRADMDRRDQPPVGQVFDIDHRFGRAGIMRRDRSGCGIDEVDCGRRRVVHVDCRDQRQLARIGRNLDIVDLAGGFDDHPHIARAHVEQVDLLCDIAVVDQRGRCGLDHAHPRIVGNLERGDIAGHGHFLRLGIHLAADLRAEQAVELLLFLVDARIEAVLAFGLAVLVLGRADQQVHVAAVGRPGVGTHARIIDCGELAMPAAIDRDAPHRALLVFLGP